MLLFLDGMAHYDTARIAMKYSSLNSGACTWAIVPEGRTGNCVKRVSTSNNNQQPLGHLIIAPLMTRLGVWTPTKSGVCGFAIKVDDLAKVGETFQAHPIDLFVVVEGANFHVKVGLHPDGTMTLRGRKATGIGEEIILAHSVEGLQNATWMYIEFKWFIDKTAGTFEIRVNGVTILTYTGDTHDQGAITNPTFQGIWNAVHLLSMASTPGSPYLTVRMCDLYLADLAAPSGDDVAHFLGDGVIQTIMPNGPGATTNWTPSPAATPNWDTTNDRPAPDDDATHVAATIVNAKDTYQFEDIPTSAVVKGAHVCILARKESEGAAALAPIVRQNNTDYVGPTQGVASLIYDRYITQPYDLNPATLAKFTAAEINAGQFGVQKVT